jgi:hypothetical protein
MCSIAFRILSGFAALAPIWTWAQVPHDTIPPTPDLDSLYIAEVQDGDHMDKVLHAEPLYIDLIRDLGARRGEKEWNVGFGLTDNLGYDAYELLVEYEWAPIDRLGLEVEVPITVFANQRESRDKQRPPDRVESLKTAAQWSFFVSPKAKTSLALGYINELIFPDLGTSNAVVIGNVFNPFLVAAKRWGNNLHTLVYTGPHIEHLYKDNITHRQYDINTSVHYMIPNTRNFIGIEVNKTLVGADFDMALRPQMRLGIAENFLVGIVTGIPVARENERFSMFTRLIWEPGHRKERH